MPRDYAPLINPVVELGNYDGYLDTQGKRVRAELEARYKAALRGFVFQLLKETPSPAAASGMVDADLAEIAAHSEPYWHATYDRVRHDLLTQIARDSSMRPWLRAVRHRAPLIVLALVVVAYFGIRLYSATPIREPINTAGGVEQRAQALIKSLRYVDWNSAHVRRGGFLKPILFWPIEPTDAEKQGAGELAGLVLGGARALGAEGLLCNLPAATAQGLTDDEITLLWETAERLREDPGRDTGPRERIVTILRARYPC